VELAKQTWHRTLSACVSLGEFAVLLLLKGHITLTSAGMQVVWRAVGAVPFVQVADESGVDAVQPVHEPGNAMQLEVQLPVRGVTVVVVTTGAAVVVVATGAATVVVVAAAAAIVVVVVATTAATVVVATAATVVVVAAAAAIVVVVVAAMAATVVVVATAAAVVVVVGGQ
jgi:hypothetical protein